MCYPSDCTIEIGDWRDRILAELATTDVNNLYPQMDRWVSVYMWSEGRSCLHNLPNPDEVCERHRPILLNFLTVHWADARAMTSALRIDGAAYLAFYMRLPLRRVKRGSEDRWERRPVKNIEWLARGDAEMSCKDIQHERYMSDGDLYLQG